MRKEMIHLHSMRKNLFIGPQWAIIVLEYTLVRVIKKEKKEMEMEFFFETKACRNFQSLQVALASFLFTTFFLTDTWGSLFRQSGSAAGCVIHQCLILDSKHLNIAMK